MRSDALPMRRVLLTSDALGGTWTYALELAAGLSGHRVETVLAVHGPPPSAQQKSDAARIEGLTLLTTDLPLHWTADSPRHWQSVPGRLQALAERMSVDLVHLHEPAAAGEEPWALPLVAAVHSCIGTWWATVRDGVVPLDLAWRVAATRAGLANTRWNIAPSQSFLAALRRTYGGDFAASVVLNGARAPMEGRRVAPRHRVVTSGRLWDEAKNMGMLDAAAACCRVPLVAAGALVGPNGEHRQFRNLETPGTLSRRALNDLLASAAAYISVARYEPFGLGVLEAAQLGLPLILSSIPTHRELWDGAAVFVPSNDPTAIARAIDDVVADTQFAARLGQQASRRSRAYTRDRLTSSTLDVYRSVMAGARVASRSVAGA